MKKFLLSALLSLSCLLINAESIKINNKFKSQIYITIMYDDNSNHALIDGNGAKIIDYQGQIDKIIINFQLPGVAPITIAHDDIPQYFKLLTIFANRKISLS